MPVPKKRDDYRYTYADYLAWSDEERWEIIDGVPYDMTPAPSRKHQELTGIVYRKIAEYLDNRPCVAYISPFDVRFPESAKSEDETTYTVVQPDILIVCDEKKLDDRGVVGAPDVCVEILSPSTAYKDETEKLKLYEKHRVREYWLINPDNQTVIIYSHEGNRYGKPLYYTEEETVTTAVLPGFELQLTEVFA